MEDHQIVEMYILNMNSAWNILFFKNNRLR